MSFQKIIVRMPNWLGDAVMALPFLENLHNAFPKASITLMCKHTIGELFEHDKRFKIFCADTKKEKWGNIVDKLKKENFDLAILLTNSFSSAYLFWRANIKCKIGFNRDFRWFFLNKAVRWPKKGHLINKYNSLLASLGINNIAVTEPALFVTQEEKANAQKLLATLGYKTGQHLIGISPSSAYGPAKCWPKDNFRKLTIKLLEDKNNFMLFFGDDKASQLIEQIVSSLSSRVINLSGKTTIRQLIALMKYCACFISNDSGPMHIAAALKIPLIALFGSTDKDATGPYGRNVIVIDKHIGCAPCFRKTCPNNMECMHAIKVEEVLEKIKECLKN
jgi:heptosyltransferase-2